MFRPLVRSVILLVFLIALARAAHAQSPTILWQRAGGFASAFSADGSLIAVGDVRSVHICRASDGVEIRSVPVRFGSPDNLAVSPNGALLAVGTDGFNQTLYVFRVADGTRLLLASHDNGVKGVDFTPNGATLLSAGRDRMIVLWRTSDFTQIRSVNAGPRLTAGVFSPDG